MMTHYHRQQGSALIIAMLLLVALAIVGLNAVSASAMQERIAGNERDRAMAFTAAESGLRNAEDYLRSIKTFPVFGAEPGTFMMNEIPGLSSSAILNKLPSGAIADVTSEDVWATSEALKFIQENGIEYGSLKSTPTLVASGDAPIKAPRFILEEIPNVSSRARTIRITSAGWGRNGAAVVLQSYYTPPQAAL